MLYANQNFTDQPVHLLNLLRDLFLLSVKHNVQVFQFFDILCSLDDWFESYLVTNLEDGFLLHGPCKVFHHHTGKVDNCILFHLSQMDILILINWKSTLPILELLSGIFHF